MASDTTPDLGQRLAAPFPLVRRGWDGFNTALSIGAVVCGVVAFAMVRDNTGTLLWAVTAAGLVVVAVARFVARRGPTGTVEPFEQGLRLVAPPNRRAIRYQDVQAIAVVTRENYAEGMVTSVDLELRLWRTPAAEGKPALVLRSHYPVGDPALQGFSAVIDAFTEPIIAAMRAVGKTGRQVAGDGFRVDASGIRFGDQLIPFERIAAAGCFDNEVCIWLKNEDLPTYRIAPGRANVHPLLLFLQRLIEERGEAAEQQRGGALGRVLFQRGGNQRLVGGLLAAFGSFLVLGSVGCVIIGVSQGEPGAFIGAGVLGVLGPLLLHGGLSCIRDCFRCCEHGVYQRGVFRERHLLYRQIEAFTYSATRHYTNGVYSGTSLAMRFTPGRDDHGAKPISYSASTNRDDGELDSLRDHIAGVVGARMLAALGDGHEVPWTGDTVFTQTGVRYRPSKLFGKGEPTELAWGDIHGFSIDNGVFHLFRNGQQNAVLNIQVSAPNFFPGFFALDRILSPAEGEDDRDG